MRKRVVFRRLTAAGIAGICIFAGAGCRQETEEAPIEITLMHGYGGTLESYQIMQEIYDEFSEQNPDIRLNSIAYINNQVAVEKANDMLAVGEMPDILSTNSLSYIIDNAVKTGMALDLMPYIEEDPEWKEQIHPSVFETWEDEQGHLYTIPDALEWAGYWYNADYLKAAGRRSVPTEDEWFSWQEDTGQSPEESCLEQEVREGLYRACKELKPPYDEIALDYYYYEMDVGEIAAKRERNVKTVQTQIYRARGMLRRKYREKEERSVCGKRK